MTRFVTKSTPIGYVDTEQVQYKETEEQSDLFDWLFRFHITPLVIHGLGGGYTNTHTINIRTMYPRLETIVRTLS